MISDLRLKTDLVKVNEKASLDAVKALQVYSFAWLNHPEDRAYGVIAQDVEKILPDAVKRSQNGMLSVNYPSLTAVLLSAVQLLSKEIEEIKNAHAH